MRPIRLVWCTAVLLLPATAVAGSPHTARESNSQAARPPQWEPVPAEGVITAPGRYQLHEDWHVHRNTGIDIRADDVTIDLCGHALRFAEDAREGTLGIAVAGRLRVTICNGVVGGFWFNVHCSKSRGLRIHDIHFDDIPYLALNVAQSKDVAICDNRFDNFRYDLAKPESGEYVIGINMGAKGAVVSKNQFAAEVKHGNADDVAVETVFVLLSADVSDDCVVAQNEMTARDLLPRSYGVWVATNAKATVANNRIRNMKYGVCLATNASALVCGNRFEVGEGSGGAGESYGISALRARRIVEVENVFHRVGIPTALPESKEPHESKRR